MHMQISITFLRFTKACPHNNSLRLFKKGKKFLSGPVMGLLMWELSPSISGDRLS